jgi:alpha-tubulin suppressor-like RCC1 family protein
MSGFVSVTNVFGSGNSMCAQSGQSIQCWGSNIDGEVGTGVFTAHWSPYAVPGTYVSAYGGGDAVCANTTFGTVNCWGGGGSRFGLSGSSNGLYVPTAAPEWIGASSMYILDGDACGIFSDGSMRCAGSNSSGELGTGTTGGSTATPAAIPGLSNVTSMSGAEFSLLVGLGHEYVCAVSNGAAYCWGDNVAGELGNGTTTASYVPTPVIF